MVEKDLIDTVNRMENRYRNQQESEVIHLFKAYEQLIPVFIEDLSVRRDKRRQGYGTKIMEFCLSYANDHNVVEVFIGADIDNVAAQKLYEKFVPKTTAIFYIKKLREHGL